MNFWLSSVNDHFNIIRPRDVKHIKCNGSQLVFNTTIKMSTSVIERKHLNGVETNGVIQVL